MSILLVLCVLAAAGWLMSSVMRRDPTDDPGDSVAAYSKAMHALDPTGGRPPTKGSPHRARRRSPSARDGRPAARRQAARRPATAAARSRAVPR